MASPADHLLLHFSKVHEAGADLPMIVRGEGAEVIDREGRRYLDGLAGLFVGQVGHGRTAIAAAMAKQAEELAFFPLWGYTHPTGAALAERIVGLAPPGIERVFFTSGGSEAVESAWKIVRAHFLLAGQPDRHKVISRRSAYHGTTLGALSITGLDVIKEPFRPMLNGATRHVGNTLRCWRGCDLACADEIEAVILAEGADTVAAVYLEPVQNAGGCLPPPPGYFARVREICDRHGVLLVSDEVICGFGRLGDWFGADRLGYRPDLVTFAKGVTSGYSPLGGVLVSGAVAESLERGDGPFQHGITFGGHPVSCAAALANLEIMEAEDLPGRARWLEDRLGSALRSLEDLPVVREARGVGAFWGVELWDDGTDLVPERATALAAFLRERFLELGLYCRVDDRLAPTVMLCPPLIVGEPEVVRVEAVLRQALAAAPAALAT